jgi:hypothetical protein
VFLLSLYATTSLRVPTFEVPTQTNRMFVVHKVILHTLCQLHHFLTHHPIKFQVASPTLQVMKECPFAGLFLLHEDEIQHCDEHNAPMIIKGHPLGANSTILVHP